MVQRKVNMENYTTSAMLRDILLPVTRRLGSFTSGALISYGATQPEANEAIIASTALIGILADLLLSRRNRKKESEK
jgi:hypothetical protein